MSTRRNSSKPAGCAGAMVFVLIFVVIVVSQATRRHGPSPRPQQVQTHVGTKPTRRTPPPNPIEQMLAPRAGVQPVEGVGVIVLVDVSGSMKDDVRDTDGSSVPKITIARRSVLDLLRKTDAFAREHPDKRILVGVYEFSELPNRVSCRPVIPLQAPDLSAAEAAVDRMQPNGDTPIGNAIIRAKQDLDASGLTHQHVLVVTDGENNRGSKPGDVVGFLSRQDEAHRTSVYFVAFDVAAEKFNAVRDAGGLVLAAADATQLAQTLDYVLTGKILAEQPAVPGTAP